MITSGIAGAVKDIQDVLDGDQMVRVKAKVVLMKKNVLDLTDFNSSVLDRVAELLGQGISFQLVSATVGDPNRGDRGKVGKPAFLEKWITTLTSITAGESQFTVTFSWDKADGIPGAIIVKNDHTAEFFLKTVTIKNFPMRGRIHFVCNSWIYPARKCKYDRIFFANDTYVPSKTPAPLKPYRDEALAQLRGDNVTVPYQEHDRVYAYDYYNDLADPDRGPEFVRPILGGSKEYPYPRRGRTGRKPTRTDPKTESRIPILLSLDIYVPKDEKFGHLKMADFLGYALKSLVQSLQPMLNTLMDKKPFEFDSFQDIDNMYGGGIELPQLPAVQDMIPLEFIKEIVRTDGERLLKLPVPQVIADNKTGWRTDEEFAREIVAGVNPLMIRLLEEFPPKSKLDPSKYGNQNSTLTAAHIQKNMECYTVEQALRMKRLFILDYHDVLIPYLNRINTNTYKIFFIEHTNKIYATRTILFLRDDSTLKPLAIELSLPHPNGEQYGAISQVYTPAEHGVEASIWWLAKAYATVNDSGIHQLVSHWLRTHAVIEPFVIATNRQLSVMHPVHKLLSPHYRDTMNINAQARQVLINAGGLLELTVFPGKYALEMSSAIYKNWKFTEQALPADLIKRGVAVEDPTQPNNIRLLIPDYPFAVDGLAIWFAIKKWVSSYCAVYYPNDAAVRDDTELQAWWKEAREVGHGDLKDEPWWPKMDTIAGLVESCTTIIWIASALHAAVNFGQYPYAGYIANRPTLSRQFMPQPGTKEYDELKRDPDGVFLKTITAQVQGILGVSLIEILSRHASDEVYLGQRDTPEWTTDQMALEAFKQFGDQLMEIERMIMTMNEDQSLKNRNGPVKMPYTLLYPNTSDYSGVGGLTGRGVPNSVSI